MNELRIVVVLSAAVGAVVGFGLGLLLGDGPANPAAPSTSPAATSARESTSPELSRLREELAIAREAQVEQGEQIELLWEEFAELHRGESEVPVRISSEPAAAPGPASESAREWFDASILGDHGFEPADADRIREAFEATELEELYLRDLATRENWLNSSRFREQRRELRAQLLEDLGEEDYDWMLYAAGRNNRVRVDDLLRNSPAADAGLEAGDLILRYAGKQILHRRQLITETTRGKASETVAVDALRGDEILRFYVPRGPLGIRTGSTREVPGD
jgi:membrane-associated protease RseP (regulator of RpoE activity)